jgi:hypothetical protein
VRLSRECQASWWFPTAKVKPDSSLASASRRKRKRREKEGKGRRREEKESLSVCLGLDWTGLEEAAKQSGNAMPHHTNPARALLYGQ